MSVDFTVTGAENLATLGKAFKKAGTGGKGLRKQLLREIRTAAKPMTSDVKSAWASELPQKGGLAGKVAGSRVTTRTRLTGDKAGVRIIAQGLSVKNLRNIENGYVVHPVFGHDGVSWRTTKVRNQLFQSSIERHADAVRRGITDAMDATAKQILNAL